MQRFLDVAFSILGIIIILPFFLPIVILLRMTGEGEIFFKQTRIGFLGVPFKVFKFATMAKNSPNIGTGTITVKNDPRVLPVGKILRKTKINEFPQLLNILKGDMSLIGPRPLTIEGYSGYSNKVIREIQKLRPGLSGVGSIVFRDEETILQNFDDGVDGYIKFVAPFKAELEVWYARNKNIKLYFALIFLTLMAIFVPKNKIFWKIFKNAPKPQGPLKDYFEIY
tara:strand:- start:446 stop:1120 length:675 start_codon:yes stop_codon:yes gene_type:complete